MPGFNLVGPLLALYTVVALRPLRTAVIGAALCTATVFASGLAIGGCSVPTAAAQALVATAAAWVFGIGARRLADRNRRLLELTDQLRQEREERARAAVVQERVRIARELHDVVAHHMSVISVHAGLARYALPPELAVVRDALDTIAGAGHEALEEMRRMLALLRAATGGAPNEHKNQHENQHEHEHGHEPAPGLARLDDLVQRMRTAGVPIAVTVSGPVIALPPGADLCAYRVIQESLTNVLKHAGSASTLVALDYRPGALVVRVSDEGPGPGTGGPAGHGLIGMRERAGLYGGTVTAGAGQDGGFTVTLTVPAPPARGTAPERP